MSQPPKNRPPVRSVRSVPSGDGSGNAGAPQGGVQGDGTVFCTSCGSPNPAGSVFCSRCGNRLQAVAAGPQGRQAPPAGYGGAIPPRRSRTAPPPPPARRSDPFPFVIGGVVGLLVVGLMVVVYLLASKNGTTTGTGTNPVVGGAPQAQSSDVAQATAPGGTAAPTEEAAPRMPMDQFLALYNDPAKRPVIIDVRNKDYYDQGHIRGAINIPEADVPNRLAEIPKDKLVVAYCQ